MFNSPKDKEHETVSREYDDQGNLQRENRCYHPPQDPPPSIIEIIAPFWIFFLFLFLIYPYLK